MSPNGKREADAAPPPPVALDVLFRAMSDIVFVISREGRYLWVAPTIPSALAENRRRADWMMGKTIHEALNNDSEADRLLAAVHTALDTGVTRHVQYKVDLWGEEMWFAAAVSPIDDDRVVWVARSVTPVVRAQQELETRVQDRTHELNTLLEVSRAVSATLDPRELMAAILDLLGRIVEHSGSAFVMLEGDNLVVRDARSVVEAEREVGATVGIRAAGRIWEQVSRGEVVLIEDLRVDTPDAVALREALDAYGLMELPSINSIRSWMGVPLTAKGGVFGMLTVSSGEAGKFSSQQARLVRAFADQAAVAIENARLFERARSTTRELMALLDVSRAFTSTLDLLPLIDNVLDNLRAIVPYDGASVMMLKGDQIYQLAVRRPEGYPVTEQDRQGMPQSISGWIWDAIKRGESVVIDDVWDDSDAALAYREPFGGDLRGQAVEYVHSCMLVPMMMRGEMMGALAVARSQRSFYTAEHREVLQAVAGQAAAAIENAGLFQQTQSQAREMAALLEITRTLASTLDPAQTLGAILDNLGAITEHTGASILLLRGDSFEFVEAKSITGTSAQAGARILFDSAPVLAAAMRSGETVIIDDVKADEPMARDYRAAIASIGLLDQLPFSVIRSWMSVPLVIKDRVFGMLTISWTEPAYFTEEHARLARAFADQAALALENSRLYEETRRTAREFEVLSRADAELFASLELDAVLQALVDVTVDVLGAEKSMVATWEDEKQMVSLRASRNISDDGLALIRRMYLEQRPQLENFQVIVTEQPEDAHPAEVPVVVAEGIHSFIQVPIISPDGQKFGFFSVGYTTPHHFSHHEQSLLVALAERAAVAITNAALHQRAQQAASLEERQRLARELHDSVSQALYGIALGARTARKLLEQEPEKAVEPLEYVLSLASAGMAEMRSLIFELRPESLQEEGLVAALRKQVSAIEARYSLKVDADLCDEPDVPFDIKEALYRIAQEALHNVVKHAGATHVALALAFECGQLRLTVTDDGRGFDPGAGYAGHLGLHSMRERARVHGGAFEIKSSPGQGARLAVSLPVREAS